VKHRIVIGVLLVLLGLVRLAHADSTPLLAALDTEDPKAIAAAVAAIETAPPAPDLADVLFAAGRTCEDRLYDPARALALYDRIVRDFPDAGVAIAASRRVELLRDAREHAHEAADLAQLIATVDTLPATEVERRAIALSATSWPGALDAALFHADWLCRIGRFADAQARYATLLERAPDAAQAGLARRNAAGCAIDAGNWALAERLADQLAGGDDIDQAIRADLAQSVAMFKQRAALYRASWIALVIAGLGLLGSLADAIVRGGLRAPTWLPPVEVLYIAPVALIVVLASYAIDQLIAPAVVRITLAGIAAGWISGATLDLVRARGRSVRLRAVGHVVACAMIVASVGYIALTAGGLLDLLGETVKFGPGA
jgi:hypothetical protein